MDGNDVVISLAEFPVVDFGKSPGGGRSRGGRRLEFWEEAIIVLPGDPLTVQVLFPINNQNGRDNVDMVLVMSVWPGFGGQTFIADVLPKVEILRERLASHQRLEIDGGIDVDTVAQAARAGADVLVAGSAVFGKPDPVGAMKELHRLAQEAVQAGGGRVEPHAAKPSRD